MSFPRCAREVWKGCLSSLECLCYTHSAERNMHRAHRAHGTPREVMPRIRALINTNQSSAARHPATPSAPQPRRIRSCKYHLGTSGSRNISSVTFQALVFCRDTADFTCTLIQRGTNGASGQGPAHAAENSGDKAITEWILNTQMSHYILPFFYTHFSCFQ